MSVPTLAQVVALLEERADPARAEDWDRVGLVVGDLAAACGVVRFTVDVTEEVVRDAVADGVDLLVAHHPLLLRGVHSVAETSSRGRIVASLVRGGCGLLTMHTNADRAAGGVNDALADALGMSRIDRAPIVPSPEPASHRLVVYVPAADADSVVTELAAAGAGTIGDYDLCAYWVDGVGQFRPSDDASPHIGTAGSVSTVEERRLEMVVPRGGEGTVVAALRRAHPYEEPAFSLVPSVDIPGREGLGRWGAVEPTTVAALAQVLADVLPDNAGGVRITGDPDRAVRAAAVCGGSGDSLLASVGRLPVDVFVTSDLRHHPVSDFIADHDVALVDIAHAAGEALWLAGWARRLSEQAASAGWLVQSSVTAGCTDPWTGHYARKASHES